MTGNRILQSRESVTGTKIRKTDYPTDYYASTCINKAWSCHFRYWTDMKKPILS